MKQKRIKTTAVAVPVNITEAERVLGEIGHLQRRVTKTEADMNDYLASVKAKFEKIAQPLNDEIESLFQGLHMFAEANRADLLKGKSKTVRLATGDLLWRMTPPAVKLQRKNAETVIAALRAAGLDDLVRTKEEINKEAILADPARIAGIGGITVKQCEEFVAKPFESEIERAEPVKKSAA